MTEPLRALSMILLLGATAAGGWSACKGDEEPAAKAVEPPPVPLATLDRERGMAAAREALADGQADRAIAKLWGVVQEHPTDLEARVLLAGAYQLAGRHKDALAETDAALELDPNSVGALVTRGAALSGLGSLDAAIVATRLALKLAPENRAAMVNLARLFGKLERWREQEKILRKLVERLPDNIDLRLDLAQTFIRREQLGQAITELRAAVERVPGHAEAQLLLAAALYEQGEFVEAMDRADIVSRLDRGRQEAADLFRAAFYVHVASRLQCLHGDPPWERAQVEAVLKFFREQGLAGTEAFHLFEAEFGKDEAIRERVKAVAKKCREDVMKGKGP